jgi:site-specific recombinase XerD
MDRFIWWMENEEGAASTLDSLTPTLVRSFIAYVRDGSAKGRWGSDHHAVARPTRPSTVATYHRAIRAFTNFCLAEGVLETNPLQNVKPPHVPTDQVQPFTQEQIQTLIDAARRTSNADRNVALILVMLDTGLRVSEVAILTVGSLDRESGALVVTGKGNKRRRVYMGVATRRALWRYVEADRCGTPADEPLFTSSGGTLAGAALTESGIYQIVKKTGKAARLTGVRSSPHTLRHTFAVSYLRGGGNLFELQQLMGHTDLTILRRYVALAEADLEQAHRSASPADRMKLR